MALVFICGETKMLYQIMRASRLSRDFKPCEEAIENIVPDSVSNYAVSINTLEELQSFIAKYGECVIGENHIIIYDYYLE